MYFKDDNAEKKKENKTPLRTCKSSDSPCLRPNCTRCNPGVERQIVVCDECGRPEYQVYANQAHKWEICDSCCAHFCPSCGPVLIKCGPRRLCALCREAKNN